MNGLRGFIVCAKDVAHVGSPAIVWRITEGRFIGLDITDWSNQNALPGDPADAGGVRGRGGGQGAGRQVRGQPGSGQVDRRYQVDDMVEPLK
jgi:hypothetical protein